ncbi:MAG: hypothetical protein AAB691_00710 [Patescibacteria group bacterium]
MTIRYSDHLRVRITMRGIPENMPRIVFSRAERKFYDTATGLHIALSRMRYFGKLRDLAVTYREEDGDILLITIHPLKAGQLENRLRSGRWKLIQV